MTNEQLTAYGRLVAAMEHALGGEAEPRAIAKMLANPTDQCFAYWFKEAIAKATAEGNDLEGATLAELREQAGYGLKAPAPAHQSVIMVAYYKSKAEMESADIRASFGQRVKAAREGKGMSQMELADLTGLNQANISRIESGRYNVTLDTIARLKAVLG